MKKIVILVALLIAVVVLGACGAMGFRKHHQERFRRDWKNKTVVEVTKLASDTNWVARQIVEARSSEDGWFTDHIIVMTNGEWIVYGAECQKANPLIRDIFVGRGSDGQWYYTTFHFCVRMLDLKMEPPSGDLGAFVKKYYLAEFDGKSDEALKTTWPTTGGTIHR